MEVVSLAVGQEVNCLSGCMQYTNQVAGSLNKGVK